MNPYAITTIHHTRDGQHRIRLLYPGGFAAESDWLPSRAEAKEQAMERLAEALEKGAA
jgi:hypothetical protein